MAECFRRAQVEVSTVAQQQANEEDGEVQLDLDFVLEQITTDVNRKNGKEEDRTMDPGKSNSKKTAENATNSNVNEKKLRKRRKNLSTRMEEAVANFGSGTVTSGQDETSNDQFPAITTNIMEKHLATTSMENADNEAQPHQSVRED